MARRTSVWLLLLACGLPPLGFASERRDAVFILGSDSGGQSGFFAAATHYHRENLRGDDLLVTTARTWAEMREWLARSTLRADRSWGRIVLVAHGSQWSGLSVPLFDAGAPPPSASELQKLTEQGIFPSLAKGVVDEKTELVIESCGIGRRPDLLALYAQLLGGAANPLSVRSSEHLVEFAAPFQSADIGATRRELPYSVKVVRPSPGGRTSVEVPTGWSVLPINVEMSVAEEHCLPGRARRLAKIAAVRETLKDYALSPAALRWETVLDQGRCLLTGHAMVLTSAPQPVQYIGNPMGSQ